MGTAGEKITVASKLEFDLQLQLQRFRDVQVVNRGERWVEAMSERYGEIVILKGTSFPNGSVPDGMERPHIVAGGFSLTHNVDKTFFEEWLKQNAELPAVKNKLIFAAAKLDTAKGLSKDLRDLKSGFQPLPKMMDGSKDPRLPRKMGGFQNQAQGGQVNSVPMSE